MDEIRIESTTLESLRQDLLDFSVSLKDDERILITSAQREQQEFGGVGMELETQLSELANTLERRGKASIDLRRLADTVERNRDSVRAWLVDPCYDLFDEPGISQAETADLRALQRIAFDSGATNIPQLMYVMRLEQRLAKVEMTLERVLNDAPVDTVSAVRHDKPKF